MFVMSYFRTESEALHLAISEDGLEWTALNGNRPLLHSTIGARSVRDPHISQSRDGTFHLFFTDGWRSDSIVHCTSGDLLRWSPPRLVPVMESVPGTRNCWAPECFYDHEEELYRLIWSSTVREAGDMTQDHDHRIWGATTRDFQSYTAPQIFLDPGYNVIDASIAHHDDVYLMAFKDERGENRLGTDYKAIRVCAASRASGPWTEISELVTPTLTEGPTLFRREDENGGGEWVMLYDHFMEGFFGASSSRDGRQWTSITERMTFPPGPRHASVLPVDEAAADDLRRAT